jgi:hypothetical protein
MKSTLTDEQVTKVGAMAIKTLVLVLLAFVCILIGAMLQRGISGDTLYSSRGGQDGAVSQVDLIAAPGGQESAPLTTFPGTVVSKSANSMRIELNSGRQVDVSLAADVLVVSQVAKDPVAYQAEQDAFLANLPEPGSDVVAENLELPEPPSPFVENSISIDMIKAGDNVILDSEQDVLTESSITIEKIVLLESPATEVDINALDPAEAE